MTPCTIQTQNLGINSTNAFKLSGKAIQKRKGKYKTNEHEINISGKFWYFCPFWTLLGKFGY